MPNVRVFRGTDARLFLTTYRDGPWQEAAQTDPILEEYNYHSGVTEVGRLHRVSISVTNTVKPYYANGNRLASLLRPGLIGVEGLVERAYINGALLRLLMGNYANAGTGDVPYQQYQPAFYMRVFLDRPAGDGRNTLFVTGVKLEGWTLNIPDDDFIMEAVAFKAINVKQYEN